MLKTTQSFKQMKKNREKIAMVTAYDYPTARFAQEAEMDMLLVGDSLGMVVLGYESTVAVTLDDMIHHTKAVKRGAPDTFIVTDMPFMTYHGSVDQTIENARRLIQEAGCSALKLEGGKKVIETVAVLTEAGVPIMGHLGLTPQSVGVLGGYKVQGKEKEDAERLLEEAKLLEQAGAFSLVLECVPRQLASLVAKHLTIPVIGIGAGADTDGQVLVYHDLIGYGQHRTPKFVKKYMDAAPAIIESLAAYKEEVKSSCFPAEEHTFTMKEDQLATVYGGKA